MAATIGTISFDAMSGTVALPGDGVEVLQRPGRDCHRGRLVGLRAPESQIATVKFAANASTASALRTSYAAAVGDVVTVTDALGVAVTNVTVLGVSIVEQKPLAYCSVTSGAAVKLAAVWSLLAGKQ